MFPTVTFATTCWEKDWRQILLDPEYLKTKQIGRHCFPFSQRLLIINNVEELDMVKALAQEKIDEGVLSDFIVASDVLEHFGLKRSDFNEWQYYNAIGPLNAIYAAKGEYLLYLTGDVYLNKSVKWIPQAIRFMRKNEEVKVANLTWNQRFDEAKRESDRSTWNFFVASEGFSDQMFLVRTDDFNHPIYSEIRTDSHHYPRGDVFEKRVFSYMKNHDWRRITSRHGSYIHENL